jgi:sec-independent protein translocase protein TatA
MQLFMISTPGLTEMIIILLVIIIFFGAKRIPELARGLGLGIKEFKKASKDIKKEIEETSRDIEDSINSSDTEETKNK